MNKPLSEEQSLAFISLRRSVFPKEFSDDRVTESEIRKLLEAARWAPTHKYTEPWSFVVLQREAMDGLMSLLEKSITEKYDPEEASMRIDKTKSKFAKSSALIAIVMRRDSQERVPINEELWATAAAVQNVQLHAPSLGIGAYWSTGAGTNRDDIRSLLELGKADIHMGWLFIGKYRGTKKLLKERKEVEDYTKWL